MKLVNLSSRSFVDSHPAYREMVEHAPQVLYTLAQIGVMFSINTVYAAFTSDRCAFCSKFGLYIYLLLCSRCCYQCLSLDKRAATISASEAAEDLEVSEALLGKLPMMGVVQTVCTLSPLTVSEVPHSLVNTLEVYRLAIREHESFDHRRRLHFLVSMAFPFFDKGANKLGDGLLCKCYDGVGNLDSSSPIYEMVARIRNAGTGRRRLRISYLETSMYRCAKVLRSYGMSTLKTSIIMYS
jgi:hypothetical protein